MVSENLLKNVHVLIISYVSTNQNPLMIEGVGGVDSSKTIFYLCAFKFSITRPIVSSNDFFNSHSHIVMTFQPISLNSWLCLMSFSILRWNFCCQYSELVLGVVVYLHPSCLCQKQPWTKITVLYFGRTISGFPGRAVTFFRYLNPLRNKYFRTLTSIEVFVLRMRDIFLLLCSLETLSAIATPVTEHL